jgi:hypothetical protein
MNVSKTEGCGALARRVRLATVIRELVNGLVAAARRGAINTGRK